ncbi:MAG: aldo/keto reductase [Clostridia bacterium]|nr:aldo/keto reductase [Clostridia bacterium]
MIYNDFKGKKISALGLGCMRFPTVGENKEVDTAAVREMIAYAIKNGVNYYDTAWVYHGGKSESVIGEILSEYPRESFYIADKFPGFNKENFEKVSEIFEEQLKRCRTDYFDFYLFHSVTEENIDGYLDPQYGVYNYLIEQKKRGRIRHLGFSTHGTLATMKRFLDAYAEELEFCQLQINWLDWIFQDAKAKVELVKSYGLPVFVMEPVRGGKLLTLDEKHESALRAKAPDRTLPEWAFRFVQGIPEVAITLSGMSNMTQLSENISTFEERRPLAEDELALLMKIAREMSGAKTVQCTACRYCTEECPQGLDIPWLIDIYNEISVLGRTANAKNAIADEPESQHPKSCLGCRACESVCPQSIKISEVLSHLVRRLER